VDSTTTALRNGHCTYRRISKQIPYTIKHAPLYGAGFAAASKIQVSGHFSFKFKKWSFFYFSKSWNWAKFCDKIKKILELNLSFSHDFPKEYFTKQILSLFRNSGFLLNFSLTGVNDNDFVVTKCVSSCTSTHHSF
jgi:hypothetical protein